MPKRVLDVGNCSMDHGMVRAILERQYRAEVVQAHGPDDALELLRQGKFDLVLVNRKLDADYSDGLEIIKTIKADAKLASVPCMLITNYADHQDAAIAAGAERGFGKKELAAPETHARLKAILG
jgi:two-component system, chemotaxis family, chemotaxis protein CheY